MSFFGQELSALQATAAHLHRGSDARVIKGQEAALPRLWREKRGEVEPQDLSGKLGNATEDLNRKWFDPNTGLNVKDVQRRSGIR